MPLRSMLSSTATPKFDGLASPPLGDEGGISPGGPESNFRYAADRVLPCMPASAEPVQRIRSQPSLTCVVSADEVGLVALVHGSSTTEPSVKTNTNSGAVLPHCEPR